MDISLKIKNLQKLKKLSNEEMAVGIGVSAATYYNYLNSTTPITLNALEKISNILGVHISVFFNESENGSAIAQGQSVAIAAHGATVHGAVSVNAPTGGVNVEALQQKIEGLERELEAKDKLIALYERMGK